MFGGASCNSTISSQDYCGTSNTFLFYNDLWRYVAATGQVEVRLLVAVLRLYRLWLCTCGLTVDGCVQWASGCTTGSTRRDFGAFYGPLGSEVSRLLCVDLFSRQTRPCACCLLLQTAGSMPGGRTFHGLVADSAGSLWMFGGKRVWLSFVQGVLDFDAVLVAAGQVQPAWQSANFYRNDMWRSERLQRVLFIH